MLFYAFSRAFSKRSVKMLLQEIASAKVYGYHLEIGTNGRSIKYIFISLFFLVARERFFSINLDDIFFINKWMFSNDWQGFTSGILLCILYKCKKILKIIYF